MKPSKGTLGRLTPKKDMLFVLNSRLLDIVQGTFVTVPIVNLPTSLSLTFSQVV